VTTKEKLQHLVDGLSEHEAERALVLVEDKLEDPLVRVLEDAPEDDEPITEEDEAAISEGRADAAAGRTITLDEFEHKYA
jgi:predicted transcriptional regulator